MTLDIDADRDGEPVPGLTAEDWLYEVGRGWVAADFDDHLTGTSAGAGLTFTAVPSGTEEPADFTVAVKKVQTLVPPELTDEWVGDNLGEFETADEWRAAHPRAHGGRPAEQRPPAPARPGHVRPGRSSSRRTRRRRSSTASCATGPRAS